MSTFGFAKSVPVHVDGTIPDSEKGQAGCNRISGQSIKHQSKMVTVLMTITVPSLLLAAKSEENIL
jgi:hypothetical protein